MIVEFSNDLGNVFFDDKTCLSDRGDVFFSKANELRHGAEIAARICPTLEGCLFS